MRIPKKDCLPDLICKAILNYGPMSSAKAATHFPLTRANQVKDAMHQLRHYKVLDLTGLVYSLSDDALAHYKGELMPEPKKVGTPAPTFKPLSTKNMAHLALRREPLRDFHPVTCKSNLPFIGEW